MTSATRPQGPQTRIHLAHRPAPSQTPDPTTTEDQTEPGLLHEISRKTVGLVVGTGAALTRAAVYACAGGAEGFVHGAKISPEKEEYVRSAVMAGNLAAVGALGGLGGAGVAVGTGMAVWSETPHEKRAEVLSVADDWTDKANAWIDSVWQDPGQESPLVSQTRRAVGGAVGEVAGLSAGFIHGLKDAFGPGQAAGEQFVDGLIGGDPS